MNVSANNFLSEILGKNGIYPWLEEVHQNQPLTFDSALDSMSELGIEFPDQTIKEIINQGVILLAGENIVLSNFGRRITLLLSGINGADVREVFRKISKIEPSLLPYEIVREGMTGEFISTLESNPKFRRVFICSPWLIMKRKLLHKFVYASHLAQDRNKDGKLDISVIVRPLSKEASGYSQSLETLQTLKRIGADIVVNKKVHAKIYVRTPGRSGGLTMGVFGSENLTGSRNIELGIRIMNDTEIVNKLIAHFYDIYSECKNWEGE